MNPRIIKPTEIEDIEGYLHMFAFTDPLDKEFVLSLIHSYREALKVIEAIESGAIYHDDKPGKTPKTRARNFLKDVE